MKRGVEWRDTERSYSERERADETTLRIDLHHDVSHRLSGGLRVLRADPTGPRTLSTAVLGE